MDDMDGSDHMSDNRVPDVVLNMQPNFQESFQNQNNELRQQNQMQTKKGLSFFKKNGINQFKMNQQEKSLPPAAVSNFQQNKNYHSDYLSLCSSVQTNTLNSRVSVDNKILSQSKGTEKSGSTMNVSAMRSKGEGLEQCLVVPDASMLNFNGGSVGRFKNKLNSNQSHSSSRAAITFRQGKHVSVVQQNLKASHDRPSIYETPQNDTRKATNLTNNFDETSSLKNDKSDPSLKKNKELNEQLRVRSPYNEQYGSGMEQSKTTDLSGHLFHPVESVVNYESSTSNGQLEFRKKPKDSQTNQKQQIFNQIYDSNNESVLKIDQSETTATALPFESDYRVEKSINQTQPSGFTQASGTPLGGTHETRQPMNIMDESNFMNTSDIGSHFANNLHQNNTNVSIHLLNNTTNPDMSVESQSNLMNQNYFERPNYSHVDGSDQNFKRKLSTGLLNQTASTGKGRRKSLSRRKNKHIEGINIQFKQDGPKYNMSSNQSCNFNHDPARSSEQSHFNIEQFLNQPLNIQYRNGISNQYATEAHPPSNYLYQSIISNTISKNFKKIPTKRAIQKSISQENNYGVNVKSQLVMNNQHATGNEKTSVVAEPTFSSTSNIMSQQLPTAQYQQQFAHISGSTNAILSKNIQHQERPPIENHSIMQWSNNPESDRSRSHFQQVHMLKQNQSQSLQTIAANGHQYSQNNYIQSQLYPEQTNHMYRRKQRRPRFIKKITRKRHATPDITQLIHQNQSQQNIKSDVFHRNHGSLPVNNHSLGSIQQKPQRSRSTYEIQRICIRPNGQKKVLSVHRTLEEPKELSDFDGSVKSMQFLKKNSQKQIEMLKHELQKVKDETNSRELASACDRALLPEYKEISKTIRPGKLSNIFHHDNLVDFQVFQSKNQSITNFNDIKNTDVTHIYLDSVQKKLYPQRKGRKYKVLKISKHSDGSIERQKHVIYKDFDKRLHQSNLSKMSDVVSQGSFYGSASAFKKVLEKGNHKLIYDSGGHLQIVDQKRNSRFGQNKQLNATQFIKIDQINKLNLGNQGTFESTQNSINTFEQSQQKNQNSLESQISRDNKIQMKVKQMLNNQIMLPNQSQDSMSQIPQTYIPRPNSVVEFGNRNFSKQEWPQQINQIRETNGAMPQQMSSQDHNLTSVQMPQSFSVNQMPHQTDQLYRDIIKQSQINVNQLKIHQRQRPIIGKLDLSQVEQYQQFYRQKVKQINKSDAPTQLGKKPKQLPHSQTTKLRNQSIGQTKQSIYKAEKQSLCNFELREKQKQAQKNVVQVLKTNNQLLQDIKNLKSYINDQSVNNIELSLSNSKDLSKLQKQNKTKSQEKDANEKTENVVQVAQQNGSIDLDQKGADSLKPSRNDQQIHNSKSQKQKSTLKKVLDHKSHGGASTPYSGKNPQKKHQFANKISSITQNNKMIDDSVANTKQDTNEQKTINVIDIQQEEGKDSPENQQDQSETKSKFDKPVQSDDVQDDSIENDQTLQNGPQLISITDETEYKKLYQLPKKINTSQYVQFLDMLLYGGPEEKKRAVLDPIPQGVGQLKFQIVRDRTGLNSLAPRFTLGLEKKNDKAILVLCAKKVLFKRGSYFLISLETKGIKSRKSSDHQNASLVVGKLRSEEGVKNKFVLYDDGDNYNQYTAEMKKLRVEHATFVFKYVPCNVGNIRKIYALFPSVKRYQNCEDVDNQPLNEYTFDLNRPTRDRETYLWQYENCAASDLILGQNRQDKPSFQLFVDKKPEFIPKENVYAYDFHGRVLKASIKNFQLVPKKAQEPGEVSNDFTMQFGKRSDNEFILDLQFPHSIYQGFGLALSAFDLD